MMELKLKHVNIHVILIVINNIYHVQKENTYHCPKYNKKFPVKVTRTVDNFKKQLSKNIKILILLIEFIVSFALVGIVCDNINSIRVSLKNCRSSDNTYLDKYGGSITASVFMILMTMTPMLWLPIAIKHYYMDGLESYEGCIWPIPVNKNDSCVEVDYIFLIRMQIMGFIKIVIDIIYLYLQPKG